jgi:p70 ribosomal S6 kinase
MAGMFKPLLFPANDPGTATTDHVELDFSDVFGPLTVEVNDELIDESSELVYDDPEVIYTRSHSLVGPSSCISQSLKLGKLTIHESDSAESLELVEPVTEETIEDIKESNTDNVTIEESLNDEDVNLMEIQRVSIEDFEVLKVVGQGAFAKVYQVRKKGTSEIYAMKVMRKDKIMEKNHAEYMKAEREILTKIEHPFVVQLRYSFQVLVFKFVNRFCSIFHLLLIVHDFQNAFMSLYVILKLYVTCSILYMLFQTKYRLYLVLDFVNGGHLFFQLYHQGLFR